MSDLTFRLLSILFDTLVPVSIGYVLHRHHLISQRGIDWVIKINVRVVFTLLSILSFWKLELSAHILWVPFATLCLTMLPYGLMLYLTRRETNPLVRGAQVTSGMLGNTGTLGGLLCYLILGPVSFSYVQIMATIQNVVLILFNFPLSQHFRDQADALLRAKGGNVQRGERPKKRFVDLFFTWNQVALLGMLLGLGLSWYAVPQPQVLIDIFGPMVHISAWIAFLPVGLLLDFQAARRMFKKTLLILPVRFVFLPLIMSLFCWLWVDDEVMAASIIIVSACPTAINAVLASALYGLKTEVAIASIMTTTFIFAVVVCPVLIALFR